ncbi:MAG: recombination protein RecR, partial [Clostridia bacterium]|nr:recombination protein RecR [Clostridia bacterium]
MSYDVAALEKLIEQFQKMPSIGRKTAQRMAFHVLDLTDDEAKEFADAIIDAHTKIHRCSVCHNLTENELCPVCESVNRDKSLVCVVEDPRDVLAMERTREYSGVYHVLHGVISPMNGIGPEQLT